MCYHFTIHLFHLISFNSLIKVGMKFSDIILSFFMYNVVCKKNTSSSVTKFFFFILCATAFRKKTEELHIFLNWCCPAVTDIIFFEAQLSSAIENRTYYIQWTTLTPENTNYLVKRFAATVIARSSIVINKWQYDGETRGY